MENAIIDTPTLESVKILAREAGAEIMSIYDSPVFEVETKEDHSPLTKADRASNIVIWKGLEAIPYAYPIVSEESKEVPYETRKTYGTFWLVDPLDGTKEFIKRNGEFTVNIALIHNGKPHAGIVYVPVTDTLYWALDGIGSFVEKNDDVSQLEAAPFRMEDSGLGVVCSRSHLNEETQEFIDGLNAPETVSKGSSLKFLTIATGEAHLYPRLAPTMEWDTAAAQCILEQAGGRVVEYGTDKPLLYNKASLLNPHFLAMGKVQ